VVSSPRDLKALQTMMHSITGTGISMIPGSMTTGACIVITVDKVDLPVQGMLGPNSWIFRTYIQVWYYLLSDTEAPLKIVQLPYYFNPTSSKIINLHLINLILVRGENSSSVIQFYMT